MLFDGQELLDLFRVEVDDLDVFRNTRSLDGFGQDWDVSIKDEARVEYQDARLTCHAIDVSPERNEDTGRVHAVFLCDLGYGRVCAKRIRTPDQHSCGMSCLAYR